VLSMAQRGSACQLAHPQEHRACLLEEALEVCRWQGGGTVVVK
jgi:hypothetical protein